MGLLKLLFWAGLLITAVLICCSYIPFSALRLVVYYLIAEAVYLGVNLIND